MQFSTFLTLDKTKASDALVIPVFREKKGVSIATAIKPLPASFSRFLETGDFSGKEGECFVIYGEDPKSDRRFVFLGLGKKEDLEVETLRRAYGSLVKHLKKKKKCESFKILFPSAPKLSQDQVLEGICEGLLFATYSFEKLKKESIKELETSEIKQVVFVGLEEKALKLCKKLSQVHSGLTLARDLINSNADDITPQKLCAVAKDLSKENKAIKTTILDKKALEKHKMGLILAVSRAGPHDPAVILLEYQGNPKSKDLTAILGKGITFDTGGLNLKPTGSMETMKCDMSGSAVVLGLMKVIAALNLPVNVLGAIATTENAMGPLSYKPGDVYISHSGKTVEISNTDAEGRLVLADLISYVQGHYKPTRLIDLATLTGAIVVALGEEATGLFSNNDKLASALRTSGERTFERVWRMPIFTDYKDQLKSTIADIKNSGGRKAGSCTAAIFLQDFIKNELPWAHLDIAGTAYLSELKTYHTTPATGVGIRLLLDFLHNV